MLKAPPVPESAARAAGSGEVLRILRLPVAEVRDRAAIG
ncbi:hypothetical protein SUDANB6_04622 [Streptomyces sp. enrichment culture]